MKILNVLKKFGSGEALTINAKFQKATFGELTTQILASSNNTPQIKSVLNDEAIKSRIWKFVLENECPLTNEEHQKIIKEIPKILVYCNKLYFESLTEKKILTNKKLSKLFFEEKLKFLE
jgi:phage/plasmid-associated DNA primase